MCMLGLQSNELRCWFGFNCLLIVCCFISDLDSLCNISLVLCLCVVMVYDMVQCVGAGFEQSEESLAVQEITDKISNFNIETDTEANVNTDTGTCMEG